MPRQLLYFLPPLRLGGRRGEADDEVLKLSNVVTTPRKRGDARVGRVGLAKLTRLLEEPVLWDDGEVKGDNEEDHFGEAASGRANLTLTGEGDDETDVAVEVGEDEVVLLPLLVPDGEVRGVTEPEISDDELGLGESPRPGLYDSCRSQ